MDKAIEMVYEHLRDRYPVSICSSLSVSSKFKVDFPVLQGQSTLWNFEVFFDDLSFPFYVTDKDGELLAHWHLQTQEEVEETVVAFMEGKLQLGQKYNP